MKLGSRKTSPLRYSLRFSVATIRTGGSLRDLSAGSADCATAAILRGIGAGVGTSSCSAACSAPSFFGERAGRVSVDALVSSLGVEASLRPAACEAGTCLSEGEPLRSVGAVVLCFTEAGPVPRSLVWLCVFAVCSESVVAGGGLDRPACRSPPAAPPRVLPRPRVPPRPPRSPPARGLRSLGSFILCVSQITFGVTGTIFHSLLRFPEGVFSSSRLSSVSFSGDSLRARS